MLLKRLGVAEGQRGPFRSPSGALRPDRRNAPLSPSATVPWPPQRTAAHHNILQRPVAVFFANPTNMASSEDRGVVVGVSVEEEVEGGEEREANPLRQLMREGEVGVGRGREAVENLPDEWCRAVEPAIESAVEMW